LQYFVALFKSKTNNMKRTLLAFAAVTLLFGSCKKDDNNGPAGGANAQILMSGKWKVATSTSVMMGQTVDLYSLLPSCQVDNMFIFNQNNSVTIDEGATKCDPSAAQQTTTGRWELLNNDTQMKLDLGANPLGVSNLTADILSMNSSSFVLRYTTAVNGISAVTTTGYQFVP